MILQCAQALLLGVTVGAVFGLARLPVPAPAHLAGVVGIAGLYLGWRIVGWYL